MYGEDAIVERPVRDWFAMLKNGNFYLGDTSRSGQLLRKDSCQTNWELSEKVNSDLNTILNHVHSIEFAQKLEVYRKENKENRLQISRATRGKIFAGDEKWYLYVNMKQTKEWGLQETR